MKSPALRICTVTSIALLLSIASTEGARAGGTGTTTGTDTTGGADESGTATSTSTGADAESSSTTDGTCEICPPNTNTGDIVFANLGDSMFPPGETTFEVYAEPKCRCEDCVCSDQEATRLRLELNGEDAGTPCDSDRCDFTVVLGPGLHDLTAIARYAYGESSKSVQVLVPGDGTSSETGAPMEETNDDGGCGCRAAGSPTAAGAMALAFVGMLARRRGRRR